MLKNYFKIAIAVLKRRKFFTFISLFGISITLTILTVITSFFDHMISPNYPEVNRDRCLYIMNVIEKGKNDRSQNSPSFLLFDKYISRLKTPATIAIASNNIAAMTIVNNKKVEIDVKYTNAAFWKAMDFDFLEGKHYSSAQVEDKEMVAVITKHTKGEYFGNSSKVVGKYIESDHIKYKVIGVVRDVSSSMFFSSGGMYLPYTLSKSYHADKSYRGGQMGFQGILVANSKNEVSKMREELQKIVKYIPLDSPKNHDKLYVNADPYHVIYLRVFFGNENNSGVTKFLSYFIILLVIFIVLPVMNLININISRIAERSSEIGVRKAFGASSTTLVFQFLIENIIITMMGGLLSILFSISIIKIINLSEIIPHAEFVINLKVLSLSLFSFFVFGILSGAYPAWRMSKMNAVNSLKTY